MENKKYIKKILFFISIIPYVIFLILGTINCIQSSLERNYLDLYALLEPIADFWIDYIISDLNIILIIVIIFCIGYPIFYLLDKTKKDKKENENTNKIVKNKTFIIYMLSFIPYLFLIYSCIFGIEFGFFSNVSTYYGFEALLIAGIIGCIIPVYPIILIFQIIYTIKKYKTSSKKEQNIMKNIIILVILLLFVPSIIHLLINKQM